MWRCVAFRRCRATSSTSMAWPTKSCSTRLEYPRFSRSLARFRRSGTRSTRAQERFRSVSGWGKTGSVRVHPQLESHGRVLCPSHGGRYGRYGAVRRTRTDRRSNSDLGDSTAHCRDHVGPRRRIGSPVIFRDWRSLISPRLFPNANRTTSARPPWGCTSRSSLGNVSQRTTFFLWRMRCTTRFPRGD